MFPEGPGNILKRLYGQLRSTTRDLKDLFRVLKNMGRLVHGFFIVYYLISNHLMLDGDFLSACWTNYGEDTNHI